MTNIRFELTGFGSPDAAQVSFKFSLSCKITGLVGNNFDDDHGEEEEDDGDGDEILAWWPGVRMYLAYRPSWASTTTTYSPSSTWAHPPHCC